MTIHADQIGNYHLIASERSHEMSWETTQVWFLGSRMPNISIQKTAESDERYQFTEHVVKIEGIGTFLVHQGEEIGNGCNYSNTYQVLESTKKPYGHFEDRKSSGEYYSGAPIPWALPIVREVI